MNEQISAQYVRLVTDEGLPTNSPTFCSLYNFCNLKDCLKLSIHLNINKGIHIDTNKEER